MTARRTVLVAVLAVLAWPSVVHADAAGPTDWRSEIVSVEPASEAVTVTIEGGDAFVRIDVAPGHEVVAAGYDGEPYLLIDAAGDVYENRNSYATYYNVRRDGSGEIPLGLDSGATPEWVKIGDGGAWAWHDHRAHWMGDRPPPGIEAGESLAPQEIPLTVDGVATRVTISTTLVERPSWWIVLGGAALGLAVSVGLLKVGQGRRRGALVAAVAGGALVAGLAQFASLSPETAPRVTWWLMPMTALAAALGVVAVGGRFPFVGHGLSLVAAAQLTIWAWIRRHGLRRGVLPTDLPFVVDRLITVTALICGAVLAVAVLIDLLAWVRQPPMASSMAASSAP